MKVILPNVEEIFNGNPQKHIEEIARTCYKSNDLITNDSHKKFIMNIYNRKHWAMLEHFIFIYNVPSYIYNSLIMLESLEIPQYYMSLVHNKVNTKSMIFTKVKINNDYRHIISFSARCLLDLLNYVKDEFVIQNIKKLIEKVIYDYDCLELFGYNFEANNEYSDIYPINDITTLTFYEEYMHGWHSIKFTCDRGVSHEIVRHRDASFAQESTRYCNYSKNKFGNEISVIKPFMLKDNSENPNEEMVAYTNWEMAMKSSETAYFNMLKSGVTPQVARSVLPNSLKTELIMTTRNYEWAHFFELRCDKTAHPQMRELAISLFNYFNENSPSIFNRDNIKFED